MVEDELKSLKSEFIVSADVSKAKISEYIRRIMQFCKVAENGAVIIENEKLTNREKIIVSLIARFLANKIESGIPSDVSAEELSDYLLIPKNQILARLKEAVDEKLAIRVERGIYKINPTKIEKFLEILENKYGG